ncbi:MAG: hypothetical protein LBK53_08730 [Heliobacteriaceae bacterium]|jgi:hypothetical protein|nr:hypothetical protein [Heliobacteriaceae bacterium]
MFDFPLTAQSAKGDAWRWKPLVELITFDEFCSIDHDKTREFINEAIANYTDKFHNAIC